MTMAATVSAVQPSAAIPTTPNAVVRCVHFRTALRSINGTRSKVVIAMAGNTVLPTVSRGRSQYFKISNKNRKYQSGRGV